MRPREGALLGRQEPCAPLSSDLRSAPAKRTDFGLGEAQVSIGHVSLLSADHSGNYSTL